uniref:Uncharacterized protein n=1 Tax=Methanococcus maripaludis (strain C6 / ATCC BAA-1332) TaxID=444158 RepID=A9A7H9_METM6
MAYQTYCINDFPEDLVKDKLTIGFGKSSSKKKEEALEYIQKQSNYRELKHGKETLHSANFEFNNFDSVFKILELTRGWATQFIFYQNRQIPYSDFFTAYKCFYNGKDTPKYCDKLDQYDAFTNKFIRTIKLPFKCRLFTQHELLEFSYKKQDPVACNGHYDKESGDWVLDYEKLTEWVNLQINMHSICPNFNPKHMLKIFKKIPERINPKKHLEWGYKSHGGYARWAYDEKTDNFYSDTYNKDIKFDPSKIIGVVNLNSIAYYENKKSVTVKTKIQNIRDGQLK